MADAILVEEIDFPENRSKRTGSYPQNASDNPSFGSPMGKYNERAVSGREPVAEARAGNSLLPEPVKISPGRGVMG
jgi:hypothetical protein